VSRRGIGGFWRSLQRQLGELLGRVGEGEALARPDVEFLGGGVELGSGDGEEVGALGEVLAQQPVGVLVGSALPGSVRIAEEDVDAGVDVDLLPVAHLRALVSTCARHELRMVRGAADSRDVFRAVSENWRRARGRAVASVLASVSDGVGDVATAVCIRQATPPLAKERASVLRCRRARPGRAAGVCKRGDRALASPGVAEPSASSTGAPACRPVRGRLGPAPGRSHLGGSACATTRPAARRFQWMPAWPVPCFWRNAGSRPLQMPVPLRPRRRRLHRARDRAQGSAGGCR
jgi:hypothetical protein